MQAGVAVASACSGPGCAAVLEPASRPAAELGQAGLVSLAGCGLLAAVLAFSGLGARPLISPAEARYALVAREMLESGDWIQPHLNHARYYEKPPLTYWSVAASYRLFGFSEFASRLPSALAYIGTVLVTFLLAYELVGSGTAPLAALIYATSLGPFLFGRFLFTDTLLVFWLSVSLLGLARIARRSESRAGPVMLYLGASLAGLTKGLIGLLFPFAAAAAYALFLEGRSFVRRLRPWLGVWIVAVVFLPWHILLAWRDPAFLSFYFGNEHFARFFSRRDPVNYTPLSVPAFWISTLLWLFPWFLFLPSAVPRRRGPRSQRLILVWIWSAGIVLFFTLTRSRMEYYALPAYPALAVILASGWRRFMTSGRRAAAILAPSLIVAGIGLAVAPLVFLSARSGSVALTGLVSSLDGYYREYFASNPGVSPELDARSPAGRGGRLRGGLRDDVLYRPLDSGPRGTRRRPALWFPTRRCPGGLSGSEQIPGDLGVPRSRLRPWQPGPDASRRHDTPRRPSQPSPPAYPVRADGRLQDLSCGRRKR